MKSISRHISSASIAHLNKIIAIIFVITFVSCSKEKVTPIENLDKTQLSAKWVVSGTGEYESFEFNESGNYIVVKKGSSGARIKSSDQTSLWGTVAKDLTENANSRVQASDPIITFGTYEITNNTISLSNFGTITVDKLDDNAISFSLQLTGSSNKNTLSASKQAEMTSSTKTNLLCRTWELVTVNGSTVAGTEDELTVLFSKAGTYLVTFRNDTEQGGLAQWKWKNSTETEFLYTWTKDVWSNNDLVTISELTSNSLKMSEGSITYVLKPASR